MGSGSTTLFTCWPEQKNAENEEVWGVFDSAKREAVVLDQDNPEAVDLLDQAIVWTLGGKGTIHVKKRQEMPADSVICALLRY